MSIAQRWKTRSQRRAYRAMVRKWYADGGDEQFRFDYELTPDALVLDLGGYQGQWASDLYARFRCRIMVFEPVARYAAGIRNRFRHNEDIEVYVFALGESTRTDTIHILGAGSSTHRHKRSETENIEVVDVKQWFDENAIDAVELMKINIEGGEYELLERMIATDLVRRVENIQVQFHEIADDSSERMHAIQAGLGHTHKPTYQYRFVWENWVRKSDGA